MQNSYLIPELILPWYDKNKRDLPFRKTRDPYCIWISEIMAQQTRIEAVVGYYERFIEIFPNMESLAFASSDLLRKAWEGLGYYSRVSNMQKCAVVCMEKYGGKLPETYDELINLPGIGPYTAAAISSIACNEKKAAVDGNVIRVFSRLYLLDDDFSKMPPRNRLAASISKIMPDQREGDFTQSLMELGALLCLPKNPKCHECPLNAICMAYKEYKIHEYPYKAPKKPKPQENKTLLLRYDVVDRRLFLSFEKRPDKGLLASLYGIEETENLPPEAEYLEKSTHVFTHKVWNMTCYMLHDPKCRNLLPYDYIQQHLAVPAAYQPFLKAAVKKYSPKADQFEQLTCI